jgi:hypothetical protein
MKSPSLLSPISGVFAIFLVAFSALFPACTDTCEQTYTYTVFEPVYTPWAEFRASVTIEEPRPIQQLGKLWVQGDLLFVNEVGEGIHIIANADNRNPQPLKFLHIPGNYDLAVSGDILYADSFIDLIVFDISNPGNPTEITRVENIFLNYNSMGFSPTTEGIITDWVASSEKATTKGSCRGTQDSWIGRPGWGLMVADSRGFSAQAAIAPTNPGMGGSMARFTIQNDFLYMVDQHQMQVIDIHDRRNPLAGNRFHLGWGIETIFPHQDKLFIGATNGMHIYSTANPYEPTRLSLYTHVNSCDPVVVQGDYAFVTLRSGNACVGFTNQLEVIDITNATQPQLVKIHPMHNPHGLGVDHNLLFICDGAAGLKVFDKSDVMTIPQRLIAQYDVPALDIIPFQNTAILIGATGISQYDYSDPENITHLSTLVVSSQ